MPTYFECQRCTACCRWPGQVKLNDGEILAMAQHLKLSESAFIEQYTRIRSDRQGLALMDKPNGECIFLEEGNCVVQPVKPKQCRDFPNLWSFPGFRDHCHAVPREVSAEEWQRLTGVPWQPPT